VGVAKRILLEHALVLGGSRHAFHSVEGVEVDAHTTRGVGLQPLADIFWVYECLPTSDENMIFVSIDSLWQME